MGEPEQNYPFIRKVRFLKAGVALLLCLVFLKALSVDVTWQATVLTDIATVIGGLAALLWISHDFSQVVGTALDQFFGNLHERAFAFLKISAIIFSVAIWFIAVNGAYIVFLRYLADKGPVVRIVVSAVTEFGPWVIAVGLFYFTYRRFRTDKEPPLPKLLERLFEVATIATAILIASREPPAHQTPAEKFIEEWAIVIMIFVIAGTILFYFPALVVALIFNLLLVRLLNWGWLVLSAPLSAAEAVQDWGASRSITLAAVFVLTVLSIGILILSLVLKYAYGG